jgi:hypothetical protein
MSWCPAPLWSPWPDFTFPFFCRKIALLLVLGRPLWWEDGSVICSAICQWSESRRTHNHTLLFHLRLLGSLSVASYDSQELRWKYSYPPPHGNLVFGSCPPCITSCGPNRKHRVDSSYPSNGLSLYDIGVDRLELLHVCVNMETRHVFTQWESVSIPWFRPSAHMTQYLTISKGSWWNLRKPIS